MKQKPIFKSDEGKNKILAVYDSLLEQWPVPYEGMYLNTRHGETFVVACGEKSMPPLVLLHGSGSNSSMWIGEIKAYIRYFRVYAVDLPGEPGKSRDSRPDLNSPGYSEWLVDIFRALSMEKACIAGISLGAWTAVKFAVTYPHKVEKLVLLCPSGIGPQNPTFLLYMLPMMLLGKWGSEKIIKRVYGSDDIPEEALEYSRLISDNFNPYVGKVPLFSDEELKRLTMPVMLVVGEKDVLLQSYRTTERMKKLQPGADIRIIPGAGHVLIHQEERICEFLQRDRLQGPKA